MKPLMISLSLQYSVLTKKILHFYSIIIENDDCNPIQSQNKKHSAFDRDSEHFMILHPVYGL